MTLLLIAGLLAAAAEPMQVARLTIRQHIVIRVRTGPAPPLRDQWREKKGPRCVPMDAVLGAAVLAPASVDIVLRGGDRIRARFAASCPALDYYSGFYIAPSQDGMICADRDAVRDRAGGDCPIGKFRRLVARK